jgi:hypothetical protein
MKIVCVLYVFHPICINFGAEDVHKNVRCGYEFCENLWKQVYLETHKNYYP